eukprot:1337771-Amorphochlora_amoeboformis.AAC.2
MFSRSSVPCGRDEGSYKAKQQDGKENAGRRITRPAAALNVTRFDIPPSAISPRKIPLRAGRPAPSPT